MLDRWVRTVSGLRTRRREIVASELIVFDDGREVARHERLSTQGGSRLVLDHYLEALVRKPGAFPGATALEQARSAGPCTPVHDEWWDAARAAHGDKESFPEPADLERQPRRQLPTAPRFSDDGDGAWRTSLDHPKPPWPAACPGRDDMRDRADAPGGTTGAPGWRATTPSPDLQSAAWSSIASSTPASASSSCGPVRRVANVRGMVRSASRWPVGPARRPWDRASRSCPTDRRTHVP